MHSPRKISDCYHAFMDGCFGYIIHPYKSASFNYRLNITQKKFLMTLIRGWDQERGKGGGYTFESMPINKQQLIIFSIKPTILNTIKDEQIIYPTFNVHLMTK